MLENFMLNQLFKNKFPVLYLEVEVEVAKMIYQFQNPLFF
jgi:hypothetical protein